MCVRHICAAVRLGLGKPEGQAFAGAPAVCIFGPPVFVCRAAAVFISFGLLIKITQSGDTNKTQDNHVITDFTSGPAVLI